MDVLNAGTGELQRHVATETFREADSAANYGGLAVVGVASQPTYAPVLDGLFGISWAAL